MNTTNNYRGPTAPSAPTMYLDLLSDDDHVTYSYPATTTTTTTTANANVVTPTADAVYMSYSPTVQANVPCSSTQPAITAAANTDKAVVMIPSNSVFIEQPHVPPSPSTSTSTLSNVNHVMTTTTSPFAYNSNNNNHSNSSSNSNNNYYHREAVDESDRGRRPWESSPYETSPNSENNSCNYHSNDRDLPIATLQPQDQQQQQRYFNGKPVKAKHAHLPDSVLAFKADRKRRTVMATCTGGAVGLIALAPVMGPFGAVIGATSAYAAAKSVGKHRERKLTEHAMLQQNYQSSSIPNEVGEEGGGVYGASSAPSTNETTSGLVGRRPSSMATQYRNYAIDRAEMA